MDYTTYGNERVDAGTDVSHRQYIGEIFDEATKLSYLNARYYDPKRGQFLSQDPVFWEIGVSEDGKKMITDPQSQNSYSYARNNPLSNKDPRGRYLETVFDLAMLSLSINDFKNDPGILNTLGVLADGASLALPIPAIIGGIRYGNEGLKFIKKGSDIVSSGTKVIPSASNYREIYEKTFGKLGNNIQVHHTLPQKYDSIFREAGVNIHEVDNLQAIPTEIHQKITSLWRNWDKSQKEITIDKVSSFAKKVEKKYEKYYRDNKR